MTYHVPYFCVNLLVARLVDTAALACCLDSLKVSTCLAQFTRGLDKSNAHHSMKLVDLSASFVCACRLRRLQRRH